METRLGFGSLQGLDTSFTDTPGLTQNIKFSQFSCMFLHTVKVANTKTKTKTKIWIRSFRVGKILAAAFTYREESAVLFIFHNTLPNVYQGVCRKVTLSLEKTAFLRHREKQASNK